MLFFFAAFIEGFVSPSALPYEAKTAVALLSAAALLAYFIVPFVIGRRPRAAAGEVGA